MKCHFSVPLRLREVTFLNVISTRQDTKGPRVTVRLLENLRGMRRKKTLVVRISRIERRVQSLFIREIRVIRGAFSW